MSIQSYSGKPALPASGGNAGPWVLTATILASSMAFIDGTAVNVALPALQYALHATAVDVQWIVEAYSLLLASLLLLGGSLGDLYGRRKVFVFGVALFSVASLLCGLAPTVKLLIAARGLQGIGAAFLVPGSLALLSASYTDAERGKAIGTWSGFTAITAAIGPALGGWLVEHFSWRSVFFINLPLALVVVIITLWRVRESRNESSPRELDWKGAVLGALGLSAITYSLIEARSGGLTVWICGIGGVVALVAFIFVEAGTKSPMLSLSLFRSRNFTGTNLLTFLLYAPLSGALFFLPLDLIQVQGYTATQAGAALLPLIVLIFILSRWSGGLVSRWGARLPLTFGPVVAASGFALFARPGIGGSYWVTIFPAVVVLGIGMAICVAPLTTAVMESAPTDEAGMASGVNNAVSRIAALLAIAVFGLVLSAGFDRYLDRHLPEMHLSPAARESVDRQRSKLAGATTEDGSIKKIIDEGFLAGYREVIWISVCMSLLSAGAAQMITREPTAVPAPS